MDCARQITTHIDQRYICRKVGCQAVLDNKHWLRKISPDATIASQHGKYYCPHCLWHYRPWGRRGVRPGPRAESPRCRSQGRRRLRHGHRSPDFEGPQSNNRARHQHPSFWTHTTPLDRRHLRLHPRHHRLLLVDVARHRSGSSQTGTRLVRNYTIWQDGVLYATLPQDRYHRDVHRPVPSMHVRRWPRTYVRTTPSGSTSSGLRHSVAPWAPRNPSYSRDLMVAPSPMRRRYRSSAPRSRPPGHS